MKRHLMPMCASALVLASACAFACGPNFPTPFLSGGDKKVGSSRLVPELILLGDCFHPDLSTVKFPRKSPKVAAADLADFAAFLDAVNPKIAEERKTLLLGDYRDFAAGCRKGEIAHFPYDITGMEEFILYLKGVQAFNAKENAGNGIRQLPDPWKALLKLPVEKRRYRTTWVLYMAGNMLPSAKEAHEHYVALRKAVGSGFKDSLALAHASYRSAVMTADPIWKLRNAFEGVCYYQSSKDHRNADFCLGWVRRLLENHAYDKQRAALWAEDEVCRELMTMFLTANVGWGYGYSLYMGYTHEELPFDVINLLKGKTVRSAGHAAWFCYEQGMWEEAGAFVKMSSKDDLLGLWVKGRLARREGRLKEAAKVFSQWLAVYDLKLKEKRADLMKGRMIFGDSYGRRGFYGQVRGELGLVNVEQDNFLEALHCFMLGDLWEDAAAIADRILEVESLKQYVDGHEKAKSPVANKVKRWEKLRWLLARRMFRKGRLREALAYYPKEVLPHAKGYLEFMAKMGKGGSKDDRAMALYNAAKILRWKGMELSGTELQPDVKVLNGQYERAGQHWKWPERFPKTTAQELQKVSAPIPEKRFHYRYCAAEHMWRVADFAERKELQALALYVGGRFIELRDPKAADKFYKRLVNLAVLPLSQKADSERWFPKSYSDELNAEFADMTPLALADVNALVVTMQILYSIPYENGKIRGVCFTKDSKGIVALSNSGDLLLVEALTGKTTDKAVVPAKSRDCLAVSPTSNLAVVAGKAGVVRLLDLKGLKELRLIEGLAGGVNALSWSPDGKTLACAVADGVVQVYKVDDWSQIARLKTAGDPEALVFSPDGKTLACASANHVVELWSVSEKTVVKTLRGHTSRILDMNFTADGTTLCSGSGDRTVRVWDVSSGRVLHELSGHLGGVTGVLLGADGGELMTVSRDGSFRRWNLKSGKSTIKREASATGIVRGAVSPDGRWAAAADEDGTIRFICNPFHK